jgi:hypothetical protein
MPAAAPEYADRCVELARIEDDATMITPLIWFKIQDMVLPEPSTV